VNNLRYIFAPLFRVWFYLAVFIAIVVLFPFIFITSLSPKYYHQFFYYERIWAKLVLFLCGYRVKVTWAQQPNPKGQYIICTNHTSMIDIMLTLAVFPSPFLFIGKKELTKLPIFGYFYKRTNILVDRSSLRSRKATFHAAEERLDEGLGVCIYPEGLAPREEITLAPFKLGAFRLSAQKGITIIPATFLDSKRLLPYDNFRGKPGTLRVEVHAFLNPKAQDNNEALRLRDECFQLILQPLEREANKK
jgi:1-acyl-sn-glycerol-3-phosphate acyltransferase